MMRLRPGLLLRDPVRVPHFDSCGDDAKARAQADLRSRGRSWRLAMNAARRDPRAHGSRVVFSSADLTTDLMKRDFVICSFLCSILVGSVARLRITMAVQSGMFLTAAKIFRKSCASCRPNRGTGALSPNPLVFWGFDG